MKIMLINPPDTKMIQGAIPKELGSDKMGKYPPLGLLYLASAVLAAFPDITIKIVDAISDGLSCHDIKHTVSSFQPDLIGMTVYTFTLIDALEVAEASKQAAPQSIIVFGGFHPSIYPQETLQCSPHVDITVGGEAEETFTTLVNNLMNGIPLDSIPGVSFRQLDGSLHINREIPFISDLDQLHFPDRTLVNYRNHKCILGAKGMSTNILSSRGCPFLCKYCFVNIKKYRLRSLPNLLEEIRQCVDLGINDFFFMDDLFNIKKERVTEFAKLIIKERLSINWSFRGRVDQIDADMLRLAKKAGCIRIHYGVESGVPDILKRICKGTDLEMVRNAIRLTHEAGIEISSNIMIGLPGESPEKTEETIKYLLSLSTDYVQAAVFTPYPETPLYREGIKSGLLPNDYWREFSLRPYEGFEPMIWGEYYTRDQLFDKLRTLYRRFYLRPRFILHYIRQINSFSALKQMFSNGITFFALIMNRSSRHDRGHDNP